MAEQQHADSSGFVLSSDSGEAFWFLNTLTINKVGGQHTREILPWWTIASLRALRLRPTCTGALTRPFLSSMGSSRGLRREGVEGRPRLVGVPAP